MQELSEEKGMEIAVRFPSQDIGQPPFTGLCGDPLLKLEPTTPERLCCFSQLPSCFLPAQSCSESAQCCTSFCVEVLDPSLPRLLPGCHLKIPNKPSFYSLPVGIFYTLGFSFSSTSGSKRESWWKKEQIQYFLCTTLQQIKSKHVSCPQICLQHTKCSATPNKVKPHNNSVLS